jgi:dipeptidyl aminopeptidase/acylaminoacyl peptidase
MQNSTKNILVPRLDREKFTAQERDIKMSGIKIASYGSWKSPITTDLILADWVGLSQVTLAGDEIFWNELRPKEGGRQVLVRRLADGHIRDLTPAPFNVRTRVHEYGGRCYALAGDRIYFSNFADQRLYVQEAGGQPRPFTPQVELRYADPIVDMARGRLVCVLEDHTATGKEATNSLVSINLENGADVRPLASGNDFYSSPCLSPDGRYLAWLTWNHPNLPWDGTELWMGSLRQDGSLESAECVAGGAEISIFQPQWSPDGVLYYVSDQTGWWNLYRLEGRRSVAVYPMQAEFGTPQWAFGMSLYGFASPDQIICIYIQQATSYLASLDLRTSQLETIQTPYTIMGNLRVADGYAVFTAGSPVERISIVRLDLGTRQLEVLRRSTSLQIDPGYLSLAEEIEFPTEDGLTAYGFFYGPKNRDFAAPQSDLPPLLVMSHGGPTSSTAKALDLEIQYWTSRGIAVLDVNYGGSSGYGRPYRQRLNGQWGVVDVDDCVNGARYLEKCCAVDGQRMAITGGSAGGYTTLCALTFRDTFKAGASYFGIGDLETFVHDTHKFESRYLDRLVGPYPEMKDVYYARSPINFIDQLSTPMILLQGLEDKIVPPNQAESMFAAVRAKGLPVAYLPFEGEQHGFRKAENIQRALEAEFYFYSKVFGFQPADTIEPVKIENL